MSMGKEIKWPISFHEKLISILEDCVDDYYREIYPLEQIANRIEKAYCDSEGCDLRSKWKFEREGNVDREIYVGMKCNLCGEWENKK